MCNAGAEFVKSFLVMILLKKNMKDLTNFS